MPRPTMPKGEAIVLSAGHSIEELSKGVEEFIDSVATQLETEDPEAQAVAQEESGKQVAKLMGDGALVVRDRLAELYLAYLDRSKRLRAAVQQAEAMARRDERFAEMIRFNIESFMLTTWNAKKITGQYREFSLQKNPDKLNIVDENVIPPEFFDKVESTVLNKTRLSEYLKDAWALYEAGIKAQLPQAQLDELYKKTQVPGCNLERNRTRLKIS